MAEPVIIIGAGICGLTLAQACRKRGIPYQIFDRDDSAAQRGSGWGLTIHWALDALRECLPEDIIARMSETYVNKAAVDAGERGTFTFFNLSTGEAKWRVPAAERIRVSRLRLRRLLMTNIDVQWSKTIKSIEKTEGGVTASFEDGTSTRGCLLIGADGSHSRVRELCHPEQPQNWQLPVRFLGAGALYSDAEIQAIRTLDPFFFQGSSPENDVFMWFSFLAMSDDPNVDSGEPASGEAGKHLCQIMLSWPYRENWLGRADPTNVLNARVIQFSLMKTMADKFAEPFKSIVHNVPQEAEIKEVVLEDYVPTRTNAFDGRVVLAGDAAHAMVMFRGEGANHAIVDVANLVKLIEPLVKRTETDDQRWKAVRDEYDAEMVERSTLGVLASRQACLDANQWHRLNDKSPLVRRRLMRADLELQDVGGDS